MFVVTSESRVADPFISNSINDAAVLMLVSGIIIEVVIHGGRSSRLVRNGLNNLKRFEEMFKGNPSPARIRVDKEF